MFGDKHIRSWLASLLFLVLVVGLIFFLTFLEIPEKNKDLITSIIGMLVGSISMAISIFVGRDPDDVAELKGEIESLKDDKNTLIARLRDAQIDKDTLRKQLEGLQLHVIERLSIFVGEENLKRVGSIQGEIPQDMERWLPRESTDSRVPKPRRSEDSRIPMVPKQAAPPSLEDDFDNIFK